MSESPGPLPEDEPGAEARFDAALRGALFRGTTARIKTPTKLLQFELEVDLERMFKALEGTGELSFKRLNESLRSIRVGSGSAVLQFSDRPQIDAAIRAYQNRVGG